MENKGFKVVVEGVEQLFKQFSVPNETRRDFDGNSFKTDYQLGGAPLEEPAKEVQASGFSTGRQYTLHASVYTAYKPGSRSLDHYKLTPAHRQLSQHFKTKKVAETVFVLDDEGGEEFVVHQDDSLFGWLKIEAGGQGGFHSVSSPAKTITTLEQFEKDITKFAKVIEVAVNGVYEDFHKEAPDVTLYLRPSIYMPTETEEGGSIFSKLFGGGQKDLLKKAIEIEKPNVSFEDVGGQEGAKREIQGLSFAIKNPDLYKKWGTKPPRGILLFGPPGTGKTLMAKALATEAEAKFYHVKVSDISSMWYGQSEKLMQGVFDLAKENGPSIIFFDEVDAIASQRDYSHEATQRVVSILLENLDGMESCPNIMVVASTNRPGAVDPALKRPGRIDRLVEVPLPDAEGRKQIFTIHCAKAERIAEKPVFNEVDWNGIVAQTDKMSGADIAEIVRRTLEDKVRKEGIGEEPGAVTTEDIAREIKAYERIRETTKKLGFQPAGRDS